MNYLRKRGLAIGYAFTGLKDSFVREEHMKIHLVCAAMAAGAGFFFSITGMEWIAVLSCITLVMVTEIINSAIEKLCDLVTKDIHPTIKYIKDISSGAVLLACLFSAAVGLIVFLPYLRLYFN